MNVSQDESEYGQRMRELLADIGAKVSSVHFDSRLADEYRRRMQEVREDIDSCAAAAAMAEADA